MKYIKLVLFSALVSLLSCGDGALVVHGNGDCVDCDEPALPDFRARPAPNTPIFAPPQSPGSVDFEVYHYTLLDTVVTDESVRAGSIVHVTCLGLDVNGEWNVLQGVDPIVQNWPEESFVETDSELTVMPIVAGSGLVACAVPELSLIDPTPADLWVVAGSAYSTIAYASEPQIHAGDWLDVECEVFDEYNNEILDAEPTLLPDPLASGIIIDEYSMFFEQSGIYLITCDLPGVVKAYADSVEVLPGLPATLTVSVVPFQEVYGVGQVIAFVANVTDRFGNAIPTAHVSMSSDPAGEFFGEGRFVFNEDGTYTVTITVDPPTDGDVELTATEIVIVNGNGPAIRCDEPLDGGWVDAAPGTVIELFGTVDDANGIALATVDGVVADLSDDGTFNQSYEVEYGINFVEVIAEDPFGEENSAICSFLVADDWHDPATFLNETISLRLNQDAIDDHNRGDGLDSINDILYTILNSTGLVREVDNALNAANPLKADSCDAEVCLVFFCFCAFRSAVYYEDFRLGGPNDTSLDLVEGGLRAVATLRDIGVKIHADATISARGWIYVGHITVDMTLNLELADGRPRATVRRVNNVDVGSINLEFGGVVGFIIDLIEGLFHGIVRNVLRDAIRDFITDSFDEALDGIFGSLDISTLGAEFPVPRLDGSGDIPVGFGLTFSSIQVHPSHTRFGMGTRFSAPPVRSSTLPGVPLLPGVRNFDRSSSSAVMAAIYAGLLNQVFHSLWTGGFFDAEMGGTEISDGVPEGTSAFLHAELPPVVAPLPGNLLEVSVGALHLNVLYPGLFPEGLPVVVGARLVVGYSLDGDSLSFSDIEVTEMAFSTPTASLDADTRATLQDFFGDLLEDFINEALGTALPALPIPGFELPASLGAFGMPVGRELGLVDPRMNTLDNHFVLESAFGLR